MQAYKTTPDNITELLSFQINQEEEGILITNYGFNVFLPNYTQRINEFLDTAEAILDKTDALIDTLSNGFVPSVAVGSPPYTPTFLTELSNLKSQSTDIKNSIKDIKDKL